MKRAVLLSLIDQALNSGFNLLLSMLFIAFATPAEFGRFAFILAGSFFAVSAQNALVIMPLNYLLPGRPAAEANAELTMLTSANLALMLLSLPIGYGLAAMIGGESSLYVATLAYFATLMAREYARNILVVTGRVHLTLAFDALAVVLTGLAVTGFWHFMPPPAAALGGLSAGNLGALLFSRVDTRRDFSRFRDHAAAYRRVWTDTRWALQGALQNEVVARSHVFIIERMRDVAAVGVLNAGRVAIAPLLLVSGAWSRVARPKLVEHIRLGQRQPIITILMAGASVVAGSTLIYGLVLLVAWPYIDAYAFRDRYGDMTGIVLVWWIYALAVGLTSVMVSLLEARRQFRALAVVGLIGALAVPVVIGGLLLAGFEAPSAVVGLTAVSLFELVAFAFIALRRPLWEPVRSSSEATSP